MSKKTIVQSALVLTAAGIITRIMGFVYRVYLSNAIGAEGIGLYQLVAPIYSLAWSIACSGFTTTISRLTALERAKGEYGSATKILKISIFISTTISVALSVALFFSAEVIAISFFKDARIALSLRILSLCLPFMAAGSCIRGYFFGQQETLIPAINQVLEQCVRMAVIYMLAGTLIPLGLEYACAACVVGIFAEELVSFIYITIMYRRMKTKNTAVRRSSVTMSQSLSMVLAMALPLTAHRVSSSLLSTLENMLIPQRLQLFGYSSAESMAVFGQITGMALPLIYFPSALLTSLSISLVPAISEASAVKNQKRVQYTISKTMLFTMIVGIGAAAFFTVFSDDLGMIIYKQDLRKILLTLGVMCPFIYLQMVLNGTLNGLGFQIFIFRNSLISSAINILFIYFLVPYRGVDGFILGWLVSLIIVTALELEKIKKSAEINIEFVNWFCKPLISALATALILRLFAKYFLFLILGDIAGLIASVLLMGFLYISFIILTGCLTLNDLKQIRAS